MLELKNIVWKAPDGKTVLDGLDLTIPTGKLVVITGPNGSGKTTLAKLIAGIDIPDNGQMLLDGEDITSLDITERAKKGISYAFQQPVRFKGITVRQLIGIAAGHEIDEPGLCRILASVGLCARDYIDREVNATLSGGEIKRIEIATLIARDTRLMVFDEPEAGIDLWSFKNLIGVFDKLHQRGDMTLVIISHQERILRIADEIVLIADGRVKASGAPDEMMTHVFTSGSVKSNCLSGEEC